MSGVKGRSGGARPNTGGARPGSGPKPKTSEIAASDALEFLLSVQNDVTVSLAQRVRAAIAAVQYQHPKMGIGGKKSQKKEAALKGMEGKFAPAAPPKLVVNNDRGR